MKMNIHRLYPKRKCTPKKDYEYKMYIFLGGEIIRFSSCIVLKNSMHIYMFKLLKHDAMFK